MAASHIVHMRDIAPRPRFLSAWERRRHSKPVHWFVECFAEAFGVFLYVYAGVGSTAAFVLGNILGQVGLGSLLQIGFGYAFGILLALGICSATSGGHFNPCVSIVFVLFRGFPPMKALRYIIAQILGAYIACLLIYVQYREYYHLAEKVLTAKGEMEIFFTASGPGGILGLYVTPGTKLGPVFLNEFVTDFVLGITIWAALDPTNLMIPPAAAPWVISFAYGMAVWGYAMPGLAANTARDLGGRLANLTIFGSEASGGAYAAIAALTNIPATVIAVLVYEFMMVDSDRVVPAPQLAVLEAHTNHLRTGTAHHGNGHSTARAPDLENSLSGGSVDKSQDQTFEHASDARQRI